MYFVIGEGAVALREPDDLTSLSVRAGGRPLAGLGALGVPDGDDHAWLDLAKVRQLAEAAGVGPGWTDRWHRMIAYARAQGWISADGHRVRAHVEREPASTPPSRTNRSRT